jgi:hypothetical protein
MIFRGAASLSPDLAREHWHGHGRQDPGHRGRSSAGWRGGMTASARGLSTVLRFAFNGRRSRPPPCQWRQGPRGEGGALKGRTGGGGGVQPILLQIRGRRVPRRSSDSADFGPPCKETPTRLVPGPFNGTSLHMITEGAMVLRYRSAAPCSEKSRYGRQECMQSCYRK